MTSDRPWRKRYNITSKSCLHTLPSVSTTCIETQHMETDIIHSHAPFMVHPHDTLPALAVSRGSDASEDADADTVSMYSESSSSITDSPDTALQDTDNEGEVFKASFNISRPPSPNAAFAHDGDEWLPKATQAGYFVFPDPCSSVTWAGSTPECIGSNNAVPPNGEKHSIDDRAAPKDGSLRKSAQQDPASSANGQTSQFLPLLQDEPNYPRYPPLNRGLEKINKRLKRATAHSEEPSTQSSETHPVLGIHPAFRKVESSSGLRTEELTALKAEVKRLKADVKAIQRSTTSRDSHQKDAIRRLERHEERLVGGWERMRDELFHIKVMQERLQRRVNMEQNMEHRW